MSRTAPAVAACLLSLALLSGCSGEESPGEGAGSPSTSDSPSSSSSSPSETATETEEAPEGVVLEVPGGAVTAPADWEEVRTRLPLNKEARSPSGSTIIGLVDLGPVGPIALRDLGGVLAEGVGAEEPRTTTQGVELAGEPAARVEATDAQGRLLVTVGAIRDEYAVYVSFILDPEDVPEAEQQAFVDEVLATYEWGSTS
jgi:hypothetical protein